MSERRRRPSLLLDLYVASSLANELVKQALRGTDVPPEDLALYAVIGGEGPLTPTALAARLGMPLSTALFRTKRMLERGHLERMPNPQDARSHLVQLSPAGKNAWDATAPAFHPLARRIDELLESESETVRAALAELSTAIERALVEPRAGDGLAAATSG
jgi:DNA-binding MarR family transcriptional regulator